jgi:trypsin
MHRCIRLENPRIMQPFFKAALVSILAALAGITTAAPVPRIIGGSDAGSGEFPFMVSLVQPNAALTDREAHVCGGTLVGSRWVLTAAHCVEGATNADRQIITGITRLSDTARSAPRINVAGIYPHPLYDEDKIANDIAMLYLATPVATSANFSIGDSNAVALLPDGADLTAVGWGITNQNNLLYGDDDEALPELQKAVLDFVSFARCNGPSHYNGTLHRSALCAGFDSGPRRDSCFGDSGGPLLLSTPGGWRQLGVTSYGSTECAAVGEPAVYVNVGQYAGFVNGIQTQPDLRTGVKSIHRDGIHLRAQISTTNGSPVNAATALVLTVEVLGDHLVTDDTALAGCAETTTGTLASKRTTYTCNNASLAANSGVFREIGMDLYGSAPTRISASISSASGDYYAPNNNTFNEFTAEPTLAGEAEEGGGFAPWLLLLSLFTLPALRRHAPHHSLRLRQFLRIG